MEMNPFVVNKPFEVVAMLRKQAVGSSSDISEPLDKLLATHYLYDSQDKVSLFRYGKKDMYELLFSGLRSRSRDLFLYIMYSINKNEDFIDMPYKKIRQDIGISKRTFIEAVKELKLNSIIAIKGRSVYWVNPMYLFNGNRIEFYRGINSDNIVVKHILGRK